MTVALIDADSPLYKAAASAQRQWHTVFCGEKTVYGPTTDKKRVNAYMKEHADEDLRLQSETEIDPISFAFQNFDTLMNYILRKVNPAEYELFVSGEGNYRKDIATIKPYKGNRDALQKPYYLEEVHQHAVEKWEATVVDGEEAEDRIGILSQQEPDCVIVHIDKDLDQLPGRHYNYDKDKFYDVTEEEGLLFFYCQVLSGDSVDNIPGIPGVGEKKALRMLEEWKGDEKQLYLTALQEYKLAGMGEKELIENARLVKIRQKEGELWVPPVSSKDGE